MDNILFKLAQQDDAIAQGKMGVAYYEGIDVPQDLTEAVK